MKQEHKLRLQMTHFATVDPLMSLPSIMALAVIADELSATGEQWLHQSTVREALPVTPASVSRALTYWSQHNDGKGLLKFAQDPQDRRQSLISLTPSGSLFVRGLFQWSDG